MRTKISTCAKHSVARVEVSGRLRCPECKREALRRAMQKAADEALDLRVERIWREKFASQEAEYYGRTV